MAEAGHRPITGQEKRIMVQNFAYFQQWCFPGSRGNYFADSKAVPRAEAACVVCAQKDYLEHRHKLSLFGAIPDEALHQNADDSDDADSDADAGADAVQLSRKPAQQSMVKHRGIYYVQNQDKVQELLNVQRYEDRWPLIHKEELHASSVQHPAHLDDPHWRWLVHTRRVPVLQPSPDSVAGGASQPVVLQPSPDSVAGGASQPVETEAPEVPPCAGVGDPDGVAWACWDCICSLCGKNPKQQPLNGLTNDNWIGREKEYVREASKATHMLSSLARCCHRQIRLGKGSPDVQQKGISGNTIFLPSRPQTSLPWNCHLLTMPCWTP